MQLVRSLTSPTIPPHPHRHLYASTQPSIEQRMDSWHNYRELFSGAPCARVLLQGLAAWLSGAL